MQIKILIIAILLAACNSHQQHQREDKDSIKDTTEKTSVSDSLNKPPIKPGAGEVPKKVYSNQRFKDVTVEQTGERQFLIKGKGQIFEASFGWVIEDGHEELQTGHQMTDAGAPEWGNFSFTVDAPKKRANSTLHLILFETSAKDGSRQFELPVLLY